MTDKRSSLMNNGKETNAKIESMINKVGIPNLSAQNLAFTYESITQTGTKMEKNLLTVDLPLLKTQGLSNIMENIGL